MAKIQKQAYKQAPWRRQLQSIGLSLLPVVTIVILVALYLIISAQAAAAGLEIMDLHWDEERILRKTANLRTELAWITSYTAMQKRASKMGLERAPNSDVYFIPINGYQGQNAVLIAPPPGTENISTPFIDKAYTQSLANWFLSTFFKNNTSKSGKNS